MRFSIAFAMLVLLSVFGGDAFAAEYTAFEKKVIASRGRIYRDLDKAIAKPGQHQMFMRAARKGRDVHVALPKGKGKLVIHFLVDGYQTRKGTGPRETDSDSRNDATLWLTLASSGPNLKAQKDMEIDGGWHLMPTIDQVVAAIEKHAPKPPR